jgi:hypothetical protein
LWNRQAIPQNVSGLQGSGRFFEKKRRKKLLLLFTWDVEISPDQKAQKFFAAFF